MKNKVLKVIRFTSLLLVILLFLPTFSLWAVEAPAAEVQSTVAEGVSVVSEDESKRTAFEKHYLLSDGTYYAVSYAEAVHEQDAQGNWVDVDAAPAYDSKDSSYETVMLGIWAHTFVYLSKITNGLNSEPRTYP